MLFQTLEFGIFFAVVYALYLYLPHKLQNRMLLVASYVFYGSWEWRYLALIIFSTTVDYLCGLQIEKEKEKSRKKPYVTVSIITNLAMLGTFKYFDFFAASFQDLMANFGFMVHPYFLKVALPIGISFYTFQTMSYSIDVYRGKLPAAKNPFDFALYVAFFPQLVSGPIERGTRLLPQILNPRSVTWKKFYRASYYFAWGFFLKVFVADNLAKLVDPVFNSSGSHDGGSVLIAVYAFSFQILCDFAGYTYMAIGLGLAMGVDLMQNFRRPYFSPNISVFWRRWHISLSSWFRDYMFTPYYIHVQNWKFLKKLPLKLRHGVAFFIALFATEFLLGLWHGAGWNFAFFGLYHALMIWLYYFISKYWNRIPAVLQIFLTYQIVCGGWLVFRSDTLEQAWQMFKSIFNNFRLLPELNLIEHTTTLIGLIIVLLIVQIFEHYHDDDEAVLRWPRFARYIFFVLLGCLVLVFGEFGNRPFIYFQF